jgi:hypothetical protein
VGAVIRYGRAAVIPARPWLHVLRGLLIIVASFSFLGAVSGMPLADTMALVFVYPFIITALAPFGARRKGRACHLDCRVHRISGRADGHAARSRGNRRLCLDGAADRGDLCTGASGHPQAFGGLAAHRDGNLDGHPRAGDRRPGAALHLGHARRCTS